MRTVDLYVEHMPDKINLGHALENEAVELRIDVSPWVRDWDGCSISINILRPYEDAFYTVDGELADGVYTYTVTNVDTAIEGVGTLEIICVSDGKVITSAVTKFVVAERLRGTVSPEPPEPVVPWLDRALQAADDAEDAADRAEAAVHILVSDVTVNFNQIVPNGNFASTSGWQKYSNHTLSAANNEITLTVSSSSTRSRIFREDLPTTTVGQKLYARAELKASENEQPLYLRVGGFDIRKSGYDADTWYIIDSVVDASAESAVITLAYGADNSHRLPTGGTLSARNVFVVNLTQMFGAGNEPESAEEFREMFKADYYPYDADGTEITLTTLDLMNRQIGRLKHAVNELQPSGSPVLMSAPRMSMPQIALDTDGGDGSDDIG